MNQGFVHEASGGEPDLARDLASQRVRAESGRAGFSFRRTQHETAIDHSAVRRWNSASDCVRQCHQLVARKRSCAKGGDSSAAGDWRQPAPVGAAAPDGIDCDRNRRRGSGSRGCVLGASGCCWRLLPVAEGSAPIDVSPDWRVLAFTAMVALLTSIVSGAWPALGDDSFGCVPGASTRTASGGQEGAGCRTSRDVAGASGGRRSFCQNPDEPFAWSTLGCARTTLLHFGSTCLRTTVQNNRRTF